MDSALASPTTSDTQLTQAKAVRRQDADVEGSRHSSTERRRKQRRSHGRRLAGQRPPDGTGVSSSGTTVAAVSSSGSAGAGISSSAGARGGVFSSGRSGGGVSSSGKAGAGVSSSGSAHTAVQPSLPDTGGNAPEGAGGRIIRRAGTLNADPTGGIFAECADVASPSDVASPAGRGQSLAKDPRDKAAVDCCPSSPLSPMSDGLLSGAFSPPLPLSISSGPKDFERPVLGQPSKVRSSRYSGQESTKSPPGPQEINSRLRLTLGLLGATVFVAVIALTLTLIMWRSPALLRRVCNTHACRAYSNMLLASINESVNPCQSFTHFVCDGWRQKNQHDVWEDEFVSVLTKVIAALKNIDVPASERQTHEQQSAIVYRSCVDVLEGQRDELPAVKEALARAGIVWPSPSKGADVLYTFLYSSLKLAWGVLLDFHVSTKGDEIRIVPGQFLKFANWWHPNHLPMSGEAYFEFLKESFRRKGEDTVTYEDMQVSLEPVLSNLPDDDDATATEHSADSVLNTPELSLTVPTWTSKLIKLGVSVNSSFSLTTTTPEYLEGLLSLWREKGSDPFHTLVSWRIVEVAALFANKDLIFNFYNRDYAKTRAYHKVFCLAGATVFSGPSLFDKYNANLLQGDALDFAKNMTHSVRTSFFRRLSSWTYYDEDINVVSNWSSVKTVFRFFERNAEEETPTGIQIPDLNGSFVQNWQQSVHIQRASELGHILDYMIEMEYNTISYDRLDLQLMPYTLSFPLFDPQLPPSLNYGGLGSVVARALGDLFIWAYAKTNTSHVDSIINCIKLNTSDDEEILEYIATLVVSYGALVDAYDANGSTLDSGVFGLEKYTGLQLLFIALCYAECQGRSAEMVGESLCSHGLQQVPEFAKAFHCVPGDPMSPIRMCQLF